MAIYMRRKMQMKMIGVLNMPMPLARPPFWPLALLQMAFVTLKDHQVHCLRQQHVP